MSYKTKIGVLANFARASIANNAMAKARQSAGVSAGVRLYRTNVLILNDAAQEFAREVATH